MKKRLLNIVFISIFVLFSGAMLTGCLPHHHKWSEWTQFSPRTCTEDEILIRTCEKCQTSEKKTGDLAQGHRFEESVINPTETSNGYTLHKCDCGEEYKDNETCLITFENSTENITINTATLPKIESKIVAKNTLLDKVANTEVYKPEEYRVYLNESSYTIFDISQPVLQSTKITVMWDTIVPTELTDQEKAFYDIIIKLKKLENISKDYNNEKGLTTNPQIRVLQYIRQQRYNDTEWNTLGGTLESDFSQYVLDKQGNYNLQSLQTLSILNNPFANEDIDFVHMIAIMNVIAKLGITSVNNDIAGWGGDLCQFALEIKAKNLTGTAIQAKAYELFGTKNSTFSKEDLLADLDALNIMYIYINSQNSSIAETIKEYYLNYTSYRKLLFLNQIFPNTINPQTGELLKTQTEIANEVITRLSSNNLAIQLWCMKNGLSFTNDAEELFACAMAFANYFIQS